ncbi:MAG: hypothetical protein L0216_15255 [Planctomycetales bacterium]|nr:hypothetical protein [Planctomycetales bacterium]
MPQAVVREADPSELPALAGLFGSTPEALAARSRGGRVRVLVEGADVLAAVLTRQVAGAIAGRRIGVLLVAAGVHPTQRRSASLSVLLRGTLRQEAGCAVAVVTSGADAKQIGGIGFRPLPNREAAAASRSLPRLPEGARVRKAFPQDLAGLAAVREAADRRPLSLPRGRREWGEALAAAASGGAAEVHAVLRDSSRIAYAAVRPEGDSLRVLESAGDGSALAGALGALARGRGLDRVVVAGAGPASDAVARAPGAASAEVPASTLVAALEDDLDLEPVVAAGDTVSGLERV